jgi:hypothetical protein
VKISLDSGRPDGTWTSWNEAVGTGDGERKSWPLPFPVEQARGLLITQDFATVEPDGVTTTTTRDEEGKAVITKTPAGWHLDGAGLLVLDVAPRFGAKLAASALGREEGDAFKVYAMDSILSKTLDAKMPKELKGRKRDDIAGLPPVQDMCRLAFMELVSDWKGITDAKGNPLPCDDATKKVFLDRTDVVSFGLFVMERARAIQRERMSGFEASIPN